MRSALAIQEKAPVHRALDRYSTSVPGEEELIQKHAAMIERCARRLAIRTGCMDAYDDFWSAGALGLLEASRRFDAAREASFESFAEHRVRGAMLDELRRHDHLPRRLRADTEKVQRARRKLQTELDHEPTLEELSKETGFDLIELSELDALAQPLVILDYDVPGGELPADDRLSRSRLVAALANAIKELPERLQILASLHYVEGLTYREISQVLKVSEPRVCQLHREIVTKLRATLEESGAAEEH